MKRIAALLLFLGAAVLCAAPARALPNHPEKCTGDVPGGGLNCRGTVICTNDGDYMCCTPNAQGGQDCEQITALRVPQGTVRAPVGPVLAPPNLPSGATSPSAPRPPVGLAR